MTNCPTVGVVVVGAVMSKLFLESVTWTLAGKLWAALARAFHWARTLGQVLSTECSAWLRVSVRINDGVLLASVFPFYPCMCAKRNRILPSLLHVFGRADAAVSVGLRSPLVRCLGVTMVLMTNLAALRIACSCLKYVYITIFITKVQLPMSSI